MRIISGKFKGRRIAAPKGCTSRPTTDRTREALFNIIGAQGEFDLEGARVLDLFAGSGALGFEALSRGAAWCLFVEIDAAARGAIRDNIESLSLFGATRIHRRSATTMGEIPSSAMPPYDIAFLDPPYGKDLCNPALDSLIKGGWLNDNAMIVIEQSKVEPAAHDPHFNEIDRRYYGDTQIGFYRYSK